jgi:hypothetical protein
MAGGVVSRNAVSADKAIEAGMGWPVVLMMESVANGAAGLQRLETELAAADNEIRVLQELLVRVNLRRKSIVAAIANESRNGQACHTGHQPKRGPGVGVKPKIRGPRCTPAITAFVTEFARLVKNGRTAAGARGRSD